MNSKVNLTFGSYFASRFDAKYYSYFAACQNCQNIPLSSDYFYDLFFVKLMAHFKKYDIGIKHIPAFTLFG